MTTNQTSIDKFLNQIQDVSPKDVDDLQSYFKSNVPLSGRLLSIAKFLEKLDEQPKPVPDGEFDPPNKLG